MLKRKTSLQQNLEAELGGIQKVREAKYTESELEQTTGQTEDGQQFAISQPAEPKDGAGKRMALFRKESFNELYELEKPYEGRPKSKLSPGKPTKHGAADEETKE